MLTAVTKWLYFETSMIIIIIMSFDIYLDKYLGNFHDGCMVSMDGLIKRMVGGLPT